MRGFLSTVVIGSVVMCGCQSAVRISRAPTTDALSTKAVEGVPFYIKVAKCKQETSWLQPVYTLTLKKTTTYRFVDEQAAKTANPTAKPPDPVVHTASKTLSLSQFNTQDVRILRALLSKAGDATPGDVKDIEEKWNVVAVWPDYVAVPVNEDTLINSKDVFEVSNTSMPEAIVDYGTTYYYNSKRPWAGSSQIGAKLAADGTLTEGSAQVESKTLSTILAALPISALLTKAVGAGVAALGKLPPELTRATTQYELMITEAGYTHTHSRYSDFTLPCTVDANGVTKDYALAIQSSAQGAAKKDDSNTVKVDGAIVLPKPPANK
jgi:hypothetical protein